MSSADGNKMTKRGVRVVGDSDAPQFLFAHAAGITIAKVFVSNFLKSSAAAAAAANEEKSKSFLATCGNDGFILVRDIETKETIAQVLSSENGGNDIDFDDHQQQQPINDIAVFQNNKSLKIATASDDHCVRLFEQNMSDGTNKWEFQKNVTRFALAAKCVAFSHDGEWIACGGEDRMIKVIDVETNEIKFSLETASKGIKSVQFNGRNKSILIASDIDGMIYAWTLKPDNSNKTDKNDFDEPGDIKLRATVCPVTEIDSTDLMNTVSVRFDGKVVAVPGRENSVEFFNLETFKEVDESRNLHSSLEHCNKENFSVVSFSPNGKFCFTASKDKKCIIWSVKNNEPVVVLNVTDATVCSMDWIEGENALVMTNADGEWAKWENVLSTIELTAIGLKSNPFFDPAGEEELMFYSEEEDVKFSERDTMIDDDDDDDDDDGFFEKQEEKENQDKTTSMPATTLFISSSAVAKGAKPPQESFQLNSTKSNPDNSGIQKRRFLCYNILGSLVATEDKNSGLKNVEMSFHDTSRSGRMPTIPDHVGYKLGVCGEKGVLLAAESQIFFKPYESWTKNSDWTVQMPENETPKTIACGDDFIAVATSQNHLRIFTSYGAQKEVLSFEGPIVTLAASNDSLAVCYREHFSDSKLKFKVFDIEKRIEKYSGNIPLSFDSDGSKVSDRLMWMGFVEDSSENALATYDSVGVCRIYSNTSFSGSWTPCFDSRSARDSDLEKHWIVSISNKECKTIVCKSVEYGPSVNPKPVLSILPLSVPVLKLEGSNFDIEEKALTAKLTLNVCKDACNNGLLNNNELRMRERELAEAKANYDKAMMKCLGEAVKDDRLARAEDIAATFERPATLQLAATFAIRMKKSNLAERINMLANEDTSDDESESESDERDEDDKDANKNNFDVAVKIPAPTTITKVQKENVAVVGSVKKRDLKTTTTTPVTDSKKARKACDEKIGGSAGDKNPFARSKR
jgi:chromosome transmission fidelity protein 4